MRSRVAPLLLVGAGLVIAALIAVWFLESFERVPIEVDAGYRGEAAYNPLYAAELFLERSGLAEVESLRSPYEVDALPAPTGTVFIPFTRLTLGRDRATQLLRWVERGGHLVVTTQDHAAREETEAGDPLLEALGVQAWRAPEIDEDALDEHEPPEESEPPTWDPNAANQAESEAAHEDELETLTGPVAILEALTDQPVEPVEVALPDSARALQVELEGELLDQEGRARWQVPGEAAALLLQVPHGDGLVTVFGTAGFMENQRIGEHDHAELVFHLASWGGRTGPVWLVYGDAVPSLTALAARHGWMILLSGAILLALWLWRRGRRLGPLRSMPAPARRQLIEHVEASGRLLWNRGAGKALLQAQQRVVLERAAARTPHWEGLSPRERDQRLAELSALTRQQIEEALRASDVDNPGRFLVAVRRLERIRRAL